MNLDQALNTFIEESRELLSEMEDSLLRVSTQAQPQHCINAIFRAAHTIKGSAGLFGLDHVVAFTHVAESLLDEVRAGEIKLTEPLVQLLLQCCDHMHALIHAAEARQVQLDAQLQNQSAALMHALQCHSKSTLTPEMAHDAAAAHNAMATGAEDALLTWCITARFGASVLQNGMDPLSFLRYLHTLGEVQHVQILDERVPELDALDAEQCYLGFALDLRSNADLATLESVFEFVRDDCELHISCAASTPAVLDAADKTLQVPMVPIVPDANAPSDHPPQGARTPEHAPVAATTVSAATPTVNPHKPRPQELQSVRVDAQKLDQLINLVGELIIASAGASEVARKLRQTEMLEANATLTALVEQVRDQALQLRMVKIGGTFSKFQRVVHDVSHELGKDIALHVSGEDTELDKTVVERIGDPLTHLVRNAIDHGIEPAHIRQARGKPTQGTVRLNAFHESGQIVIEISDDGGGLDRDRILAKGVERGLVESGRNLSDKEIYALIFEPGFSTAEQVTNLSGRGVGMDVVRSNITALRGTVELDSQPGAGTKVQVRLPLTLAIINGFQVRVGKSVFVIPLEMVDECVEYAGNGSNCYTDLRGSVLPFVPLHTHFGIEGPRSARPNIVVIKHGSQRFGLLVDELLGEAQTVIKPLSRLFSQAQGISGSSILGNGSVALILDIPVLHNQLLVMAQNEASHTATPKTNSVQPALH